ncbi:MAG: ABC transporter ATP-binding protein [Actinobacteria bacterium]|nr:ABC transporter ATP-binding protein [Actinomycetota bacterium]
MKSSQGTEEFGGQRPALRTLQLAKDYGDRPAVLPLDLEVPFGQHVALVGHNGSGKTTLLRMVAGLLDPSGGSAYISGHRSGSASARASLSWLSDTPTFYDDLSLREHLHYVARLHSQSESSAPAEARAEELLVRLQLENRGDDIPTSFSRGLRQKAAIAIALVRPFQLLLVDEPFVGLDEAGKQSLLELLDEAAGAGATLVVATHELAFVDRVHRLLALRDGELVYDGAPGATDVHRLVRPG